MALLRQQNREASSSEQSADDEFENLFDQYVTSDILDPGNHLVESNFVGVECSALRVKATSGGIAAGPTRAVNAARRLESQPWQMPPWHQIAALPVDSQGENLTLCKESSGRAVVSDGELLSLEDRIPQIHPLVPLSSPPTPSPSHSAPSLTKRTEDFRVPSRNVCRDPTFRTHRRKNSRASPTMNRMHTYQQEPPQSWHQPLNSSSATSNLQVPPAAIPCTPPPAAGRQDFSAILTSKGESLSEGFGHDSSSQGRQFPVQSSPTVIVHNTQRPGVSHRSISSAYYPSSTQGFVSTINYSSASSEFPVSALSGFETSQTQPWEYPAHTVSVSQPSQPAYQFSRVEQAPKSLIQYPGRNYDSPMLDHSASTANSGLMIHNANPPSPEDHLMTGMSDDNSPTYFSAPAGDPMAILSPDISSQGHVFEGLPAKQPRLSVSSDSPPSRSLSRSPGPQGHCHRSSKASSGSSRVRKHSGGGGYTSGQPRTPNGEQAPNSSRRKHSNGSSYSSGQQPRSPSGEIEFRNLTADDSQLILAGVAPSGSSKTKERREKEAREKRKKVHEMAYAAVRAAGGDTEVFVQRLQSET